MCFIDESIKTDLLFKKKLKKFIFFELKRSSLLSMSKTSSMSSSSIKKSEKSFVDILTIILTFNRSNKQFMLTIMKTSIIVYVFSFNKNMFVESIERWWMFFSVEISRVLNESALKKKKTSSISIKINFFDRWIKTSSTSNWSID